MATVPENKLPVGIQSHIRFCVLLPENTSKNFPFTKSLQGQSTIQYSDSQFLCLEINLTQCNFTQWFNLTPRRIFYFGEASPTSPILCIEINKGDVSLVWFGFSHFKFWFQNRSNQNFWVWDPENNKVMLYKVL